MFQKINQKRAVIGVMAMLAAVLVLAPLAILGPSRVAKAATNGWDAWRQNFLSGGGIYSATPPSLADQNHNEFQLDASGRLKVDLDANTAGTTTQQVVGAAAAGAAKAGNPVLIAGQDGTNAQTISTDTSGRAKVLLLGNAAATLDQAPGSAIPTNAVMVGGSDGTNLRAISMDTAGRVKSLLLGNAAAALDQAPGSAIPANAVFVGGSDGTNLRAFSMDQTGLPYTAVPSSGWYVGGNTADTVNTQATASKAAGAAGVKHVCTSITAQLFADGTGNADQVLFNLRDGATGAGTIIAQFKLNLATGANTVGDRITVNFSPGIVGTAATAMTFESSAAPAAHTAATCSIVGYDIKP